MKELLLIYMLLIASEGNSQPERMAYLSIKENGDTVYVMEFTPAEIIALRVKKINEERCTQHTTSLQDQLYTSEIRAASQEQRALNCEGDYGRLSIQSAKDALTLKEFSKTSEGLLKDKVELTTKVAGLDRKVTRLQNTAIILGSGLAVSIALLYVILR